MKQGQEIHLSNLSSSLEVKKLNDTLNFILNTLSTRFDLSSSYTQHIFNKTINVRAGEWTMIEYDKVFYEDPSISVFTEDGSKIKIRHIPGDVNYRAGLQIAFDDISKQGSIFITAIGKILLRY